MATELGEEWIDVLLDDEEPLPASDQPCKALPEGQRRERPRASKMRLISASPGE